MVKTIGNPLSWAAQAVGLAGSHAGAAVDQVRSHDGDAEPIPQKITVSDLREALRQGGEDFSAFRTDVLMLVFLYPVIGLTLVWFAFDMDLLPLLFPLISGFALVGPVAAVGLYEMSKKRELGEKTSWADAFSIIRSPSLAPILMLGIYLLGVFLAWLFAARWIYNVTLGPEPPTSMGSFLYDVLTTSAGWGMMIFGMGVGFVFALAVLAISVVSFPLLVDRPLGLATAVVTSIRVMMMNLVPVCIWGLIVAAGLVIGALPFLLGLLIVMPILGHSTWHLYRKAVKFPE